MVGGDCGELYDLEADPHEARNLYGEQAYQEIVEQCEQNGGDGSFQVAKSKKVSLSSMGSSAKSEKRPTSWFRLIGLSACIATSVIIE